MQQLPLITRTLTLPPELPLSVRASLAGKEFSFPLPRALKLRMRHPDKIKVSEWAEKYRVVTDGAHTGPWRHEYAPHTRQIMDTFSLPWVREIWYCAVEQSGKTATMLNCIGWAIDCDPGGIFYLMPTEDTAAKITGGKLRPMLQHSPRLARYLSARQDDATLARINLSHGVTIFPAHANSPSSMATWSAKHCFGDEVDKYPALAGKEADPITLIKKRNRTFRGRYKRFFASTPAGLFIHKGLLACHQIWEYRLRCPDCHDLVRLTADCLAFPPLPVPSPDSRVPSSTSPESRVPSPEDVERHGATVHCPACAAEWDDRRREEAIRGGRWLCVKGEELTRPAKVGFHHRAWECLDISITEIAVAWLKSQQGGLAERIAWANGYEAVDYEQDDATTMDLDGLLARTEEYGPEIPAGACLLTAGADVQADRIEVEVVAWGPGQESWGIDYAILYGDTRLPEVWEQLDRHLQRRWQHAHGAELTIARAFIDSGYLPQQVYRFTAPRKWRHIYAIEGSQLINSPEIQGPSKRNRGGLQVPVYVLGVNRIKTGLFAGLGLTSPGPGFCHLPVPSPQSPVPAFAYPSAWFTQIQAEHPVKDDKHPALYRWEKRKGGLRNEAIDCRVYALAALMSMRVDLKGMLENLRGTAPARQRTVYSEGVKRG